MHCWTMRDKGQLLPVFIWGLCVTPVPATSPNHPEQPGRPVKVAAIAIGTGGNHDQKLPLAIKHLETAGQQGVDIACLPEEFAGLSPEPIPGPTTQALAKVAQKHRMYVVCPIREQAGDGRQYNTAVLLDRQGKVAGTYRKVFVFWGEGVHCSQQGVRVFDTDVGRIALLTCFDINFDELWQSAERQGAEMVIWPSAYGGGLPLNGYAMIHNYPIIAVGNGDFIDLLGHTMKKVEQPCPQQFITTLDLDWTLVHENFNSAKVAKMLQEHRGEIEVERRMNVEAWWLLRAVKPGVRVRGLCKQYHIETLREYRQRSREQINQRREKGERV